MKNIDKQPGIKFVDIILEKEMFQRIPEYPDEVKINVAFEYEGGSTGEQYIGKLTTKVTCMSPEDAEVLSLECSHVGIFETIKGEENMDMEEYIKSNAAALMFPFVREHIYSITKKAGINPISLPPMNILAMIKSELTKE